MLERLQIRNYVLIDSLEITFPEGLIIITGQTGAGKSILLGALSLIMGAKADSSVIGGDSDSCVVEAEFRCPDNDIVLRTMIEDNDLDWDDGRMIIRRVVNRTGRSRAFVNDSPVALSLLSGLAQRMIDIHSQHQTLLLSDRSFQLGILDMYAGNGKLLKDCSSKFRELNVLKAELEELNSTIASMDAEREYNDMQYSQLLAANLVEGELEELEQEQKQLANAEEIKESLGYVQQMCSDGASADSMSLDSMLKESCKLLSRVSRYVPEAQDLSSRMDSCRTELDDILSEVASMNAGIELSQQRLEEVETRMSLIYSLLHKHSCSTVAELVVLRDSFGKMLSDTSALQEKKDALLSKMSGLSLELEGISSDLHKSREKAIPGFEQAITDLIHSLELSAAVFEVDLIPSAMSVHGKDSVRFLFSSTGTNCVELAKCASGGELSRIMLSLKSMMARFTSMPTMVFDEIDTGVSGSVADKMGSMICEMGQFMQVFAITHLPQVAAKGRAHYLVSKSSESGKTVSSVVRLSDEERIQELARMLSGSELSAAAVANARELLGF